MGSHATRNQPAIYPPGRYPKPQIGRLHYCCLLGFSLKPRVLPLSPTGWVSIIPPPAAATGNLIFLTLHFLFKYNMQEKACISTLNCHKLNTAWEPAAGWRRVPLPRKSHHAPFQSLPLARKRLAFILICCTLTENQAKQKTAWQALASRKPGNNTLRPALLWSPLYR